MDTINRLAGNPGIDENFAAPVQAHLKKTGKIPADEPGEGRSRRRGGGHGERDGGYGRGERA